jgi:hypothetical protein
MDYENLISIIKQNKHKDNGNDLEPIPSIYYIGMLKSGSTSIQAGFPTKSVAHWHHINHFKSINKVRLPPTFSFIDLITYIGKKYNFKPLIIESIREPISQIISHRMNHITLHDNCICNICNYSKSPSDRLIQEIKSTITIDDWLKKIWIPKLVCTHFNIDILENFNKYKYYDLENVRILFIRFEDIDDRPVIFESIGMTYIPTKSNETLSISKVRDIYKFVNDNIYFTESELNTIYDHPVVKQIYSPDEISTFRKKYKNIIASIHDQICDEVIKMFSKRIEIGNPAKEAIPSIYYIGMPKTGSTSIKFGFPNNTVAHFHSVAHFEQIYNTNILSNNNLDLYDVVKYVGRKYNFKPLIIESIREPVSQLLSAFFQNHRNEEFRKSFISYEKWVNYENRGIQSIHLWKKHFGIDLTSNFERYKYFELDAVKLLFIRLEDSYDRKQLFKEIGYSYSDVRLKSTEIIVYKNIKRTICMTEPELDAIYSGLTKVFYSPNEIASFRRKYTSAHNHIYDTLIDAIITKRIELNKYTNPYPTIFYIGMEKTASSSIIHGIQNHTITHFHSTEYFERRYDTNLLTSNGLDIYDLIIYAGKKYNFKPLIIESIREPISQMTSAIVQHLKHCSICKDPIFCDDIFPLGVKIDGIQNIFGLIRRSINPHNWVNYRNKGFQSMKLWKKHFGIDLTKKRYQYIQLEDANLLLLRFEDIESRPSVFESLGYDYIETHSNQTEKNKKVGELYMDIKRRLKFTKEELDNIYSGEVRLFYTDEEIAGFKEKYMRR